MGLLIGFHAVIGGLRGEPHWYLNEADAKAYGQAMANAARHLPMHATQKALDYGAFLIAAFSFEAPRVMRSLQLARQSSRPQQQPMGQVFQFTPPSRPASPPPAPPPSPASATPPTAEGGGFQADGVDAPIGGY